MSFTKTLSHPCRLPCVLTTLPCSPSLYPIDFPHLWITPIASSCRLPLYYTTGTLSHAMNITPTVYYCTYTKTNDELPRFSTPFTTEQAARDHAQQLATQGYWGAIEKHHEFKQDYENDYAWHVDWNGFGEQASELLDYF